VDDDRGLVAVSTNPFADTAALLHSNYCRHDGTRLVHAATGEPATPLSSLVHDGVLALALNPQFSCLGARSALRRGAYRFGFYPALGCPRSAAGLARDLFTFVQEAPAFDGELSTYIASFEGPVVADEPSFEALLWSTLQQLHDVDAPHHAWDRAASADPADPHFSFSFAGTAFFIVGLHAASSRAARRFAWPTLAFNPHRQFEMLKAQGQYSRFQTVIRSAERSLQGDVNPMLSEFGARSEAAQYSGRKVGEDWRCPFHARASGNVEEKL
jgi:FPC/CPF motif-containing protein YcgG